MSTGARVIRSVCCGLAKVEKDGLSFTGYDGFQQLWFLPVWQHLARQPLPADFAEAGMARFPRPHEARIAARHQSGKPTRMELHYAGKLEVHDSEGKPVAEPRFRYNDEMQFHELTVPADAADSEFRILAQQPQRLDANNLHALVLPWNPDSVPLIIKYRDNPPFTVERPQLEKWQFTDPDRKRPAGRFGRGVRVSLQQSLRFNLGSQTGTPYARKFLDGRHGTIEFFIRFERTLKEGSYNGERMSLR